MGKHRRDELLARAREVEFMRDDIFDIPYDEIIYCMFDSNHNGQRGVFLHTRTDVIFKKGNFKWWLKFLNRIGCKFEIVDRNAAVCIDNIKRVHKKDKWIYFDDVLTSQSKKCPITLSHIKRLKNELEPFTY